MGRKYQSLNQIYNDNVWVSAAQSKDRGFKPDICLDHIFSYGPKKKRLYKALRWSTLPHMKVINTNTCILCTDWDWYLTKRKIIFIQDKTWNNSRAFGHTTHHIKYIHSGTVLSLYDVFACHINKCNFLFDSTSKSYF